VMLFGADVAMKTVDKSLRTIEETSGGCSASTLGAGLLNYVWHVADLTIHSTVAKHADQSNYHQVALQH
jgi:hypothetical protein